VCLNRNHNHRKERFVESTLYPHPHVSSHPTNILPCKRCSTRRSALHSSPKVGQLRLTASTSPKNIQTLVPLFGVLGLPFDRVLAWQTFALHLRTSEPARPFFCPRGKGRRPSTAKFLKFYPTRNMKETIKTIYIILCTPQVNHTFGVLNRTITHVFSPSGKRLLGEEGLSFATAVTKTFGGGNGRGHWTQSFGPLLGAASLCLHAITLTHFSVWTALGPPLVLSESSEIVQSLPHCTFEISTNHRETEETEERWFLQPQHRLQDSIARTPSVISFRVHTTPSQR